MPFPDVRDAKKVSYTEGSLLVSRTSVREHLTIHGLKSVIQKRNKMTATAKKHVYMSDLHFEHNLWLRELNFAKDELPIFVERLADVIEKNTDKEFTAMAESFQNRLIRQKEVVDELRHAIKAHESELAHYAIEHPIAIDHVHFVDHVDLREKMVRFTTLYATFKKDFLRFIIQWM
jgi:hypothetical protein